MIRPAVFTLVAVLGLAACSLIPSGWRIGGSPLDKNDRAQAKLEVAKENAVIGAQAAVHKAGLALQQAPADNRPVAVARDFVAEAQALLDQSQGAPTVVEEAAWRSLVAGLLSENSAVRAEAEKQRAADAVATGDLARRLASATAAAERANSRALVYAHDREELADFAAKLKLGFYALIGVLVLGSVLSFVARSYPAFGLASKVVNGVVTPGITFAAHRAEEGLVRVGQGMARLRSLTANAEQLIERAFDGVTDADHQQMIAAGAAAAKPKP